MPVRRGEPAVARSMLRWKFVSVGGATGATMLGVLSRTVAISSGTVGTSTFEPVPSASWKSPRKLVLSIVVAERNGNESVCEVTRPVVS